ncbi:nuclease domain-containing protein, partial [Trifolium medium]|nr:nuclease domain-containing protein [Trifolium medium]
SQIWENYVEREEVSNGTTVEKKQQELLKVTVTEVLGGGKFYVQPIGDSNLASLEKQLANLNLQETPLLGA